MPKSRKRKQRTVERPARNDTWWWRNRRYVDSGATFGCLPLLASVVLSPVLAMALG